MRSLGAAVSMGASGFGCSRHVERAVRQRQATGRQRLTN
jgi:hypothetical protein